MTQFQKNALAFVAQHKPNFATPQADGSVLIYFDAVNTNLPQGFQGRLVTMRERAANGREVRNVLGY